MPRNPPDFRAQRVMTAVKTHEAFTSDDADERHLFLLMTTNEVVSTDVEEATLMWLNEDSRHVFNALLVAKATDDEVCSGLDVSVTALMPYKRLFFDRSVFRNAMDVVYYVKNLPVSDEVRRYYTTAIEQGPAFLINKFRVGTRPTVDPRAVLQLVMTDAADRFVAHRGQDLSTVTAREALRWGSQALQAASLVIDKATDDRHNVLSDLQNIMLTTVDRTNGKEVEEVDPEDVV